MPVEKKPKKYNILGILVFIIIFIISILCLKDNHTIMGDVNFDNIVDSTDASLVLAYWEAHLNGNEFYFTVEAGYPYDADMEAKAVKQADVVKFDSDSSYCIDNNDAYEIMRMYVSS